MSVDAGQAPREDTPQGKRDYRVSRPITVTVKADDEAHAAYLASLGTKLWVDWDWEEGSEPRVEEA